MSAPNIPHLIQLQRDYFRSGKTRSLATRTEVLRKISNWIVTHEARIFAALKADLGKPAQEAYVGEVRFVIEDIKHVLAKVEAWTKTRKVPSPLALFPSHGEVRLEPYGVVLIQAPWNYPFQLLLSPLVGAIAAGNTAVLKPSEFAVATQEIVAELVAACCDPAHVTVVKGDASTSQKLLAEKFDYIFFTGSTNVGRKVMQAAAQHLTPVTLELGGKSPCIVDAHTDIEKAATRIAWGKFFNAGQTCVAPDYLYVHESIRTRFVFELGRALVKFYGENPQQSPDYARIINASHFERLIGLIDPKKVKVGGTCDAVDRYIAPTLLHNVTWDDAIMQQEIFGPLLPIFGYENIDDVIRTVNQHPKPLALYFFSNDKALQEKVLEEISFGGGCINDCIVHLSNFDLPFGGVGDSGLGAYHGRYSIETFSHQKGVLRNALWFDPDLRYPPYSDRKLSWMRKL
ncbi:MAG: aldehyde dehydrogenase [Bdellovibrionales bacterium]|nr:aldehyde dehydrogenase [Bdellovibrionales bacterium]